MHSSSSNRTNRSMERRRDSRRRSRSRYHGRQSNQSARRSRSRTAPRNHRSRSNRRRQQSKQRVPRRQPKQDGGETINRSNDTADSSKFAAVKDYKAINKVQVPVLPVLAHKEHLLRTVRDNDFVVCVGETGSGKTTQVPQYLLETSKGATVAATQPRRVAAISVAKRVADERGVALGTSVGYTIRFDDKTSDSTRLCYMTDGVLVQECARDPLLERYTHVVLDEAHERSVHTDVLLGLLKGIVPARRKKGNPLKVLVTSATLDHQRFSRFLENCPVIEIPGRSHPVEIYHSAQPAKSTQADRYVKQAVDTAFGIHLREAPGDILVFLTGQREIEQACEQLRMKWDAECKADKVLLQQPGALNLSILPLYGALSSEKQHAVFVPALPGFRKVIFATNIAETSLTMDGICYVVDPGFVKQKIFQPDTVIDALLVVPISQTAAQQRAGRAGRTQKGKCYRLYSEIQFKERDKDTVPEVERVSLVSTVLQLKVLGVQQVMNFDFLDPPNSSSLREAIRELVWLGAIEPGQGDSSVAQSETVSPVIDGGTLTKLGKQMSRLPVEPPIARMLVEADSLGCLDEALSIAAMLSVENVFIHHATKKRSRNNDSEWGNDERAREKHQKLVAERHAKFYDADGDTITLLRVYQAWRNEPTDKWCKYHFLHSRALRQAEKIRKQLAEQTYDAGFRCSRSRGDATRNIRKAIFAGFFSKTAIIVSTTGTYRALVPAHDGSSRIAQVDPNSVYAFVQPPMYVVFTELVATSRLFMRNVTAIDEEWIKGRTAELESPIAVETDSKNNVRVALQSASQAVQIDPKTGDSPCLPKSSDVSISDARARYLARKKQQHK